MLGYLAGHDRSDQAPLQILAALAKLSGQRLKHVETPEQGLALQIAPFVPTIIWQDSSGGTISPAVCPALVRLRMCVLDLRPFPVRQSELSDMVERRLGELHHHPGQRFVEYHAAFVDYDDDYGELSSGRRL